MELHIPHGSLLMLRNIPWYVTSQSLSKQLLEGSGLEALGSNTSDILAAAADCYNCTVDLSNVCADSGSGCTARSYYGAYHSAKRVRNGSDDKSEWCVDLGKDGDREWEEAPRKALDNPTKTLHIQRERKEKNVFNNFAKQLGFDWTALNMLEWSHRKLRANWMRYHYVLHSENAAPKEESSWTIRR